MLSISQGLDKADSLFNSGKYTEANKVYDSIYTASKGSPSMLLKMAFIQEGLENYADALFYLNQYYGLSADKKVLVKMREIAESQGLRGYEYSDLEFFKNLVHKYKSQVLGLLYGLSALLIVLIIFNKRSGKATFSPMAFQVIVVISLILTTNDFFSKPKGIIDKDQTLLMSGPSAGAEPIDIIGKGHRVSVLETNDVWIKINWGESTGYIRKNRLKLI